MSRDCQTHVRACERCQKLDKTTPKPSTMTERVIVTQPFQDIAIDIVGPFPTAVGGFRFLLTCIDNATRWPEAVPLRTTTARVVISSLTEIFSRCGFPSRLTSDNGSQFTGKVFTKWLRDKGIQHSRTTPYHPQGNGDRAPSPHPHSNSIQNIRSEGELSKGCAHGPLLSEVYPLC